MAALTKDRDTPMKHHDYVVDAKVEAGETIFAGSMVNVDVDGFHMPGQDTASHKCVGVAKAKIVNAGADGAERVDVGVGIYAFGTTGGSALVQADVGKLAYVLDDQTVVKAAGTVNSVVAGVVIEFESASKIWIDFRRKSA